MRLLIGALVLLSTMLTFNAFAEQGTASWYGNPYHGRRAANGSIYNMYKMTAAHRFLPFGTKVNVENVNTKQSVVLTITDRGPFAKGRVLDVSKAAAIQLGMIKSGTAPVKITVIPKDKPAEKVTEDLELAKVETPASPEVTPVTEEVKVTQEVEPTLTPEQEKEQLLKEMDHIVARLKELEAHKTQ